MVCYGRAPLLQFPLQFPFWWDYITPLERIFPKKSSAKIRKGGEAAPLTISSFSLKALNSRIREANTKNEKILFLNLNFLSNTIFNPFSTWINFK